MPQQDLASLKLTAAERQQLATHLAGIRAILGDRLASLSKAQRIELTKMGDATRAFCAQAVPAIQQNAAVLSETVLDRTALGEDWADYAGLEEFLTDYRQLGEGLEDTLLALGSDIMVACIFGVGFLKALNKVDPSLDDLLRELKASRRRPPQPKAKPAPKLKAARRRAPAS